MAIFKGIDYQTYSLTELRELTALLSKSVLPQREQAIKAEGVAQVTDIMRTYKLSVADLANKPPAPRVKVAPRYANPNDPGKPWSGRGREPKWMREYEQAGGQRAQLLIARQEAA